MAKNQVQFQRGLSWIDFLSEYGTEKQFHRALYQWRWPNWFDCPECGHTQCCEITTRQLYQCSLCHHQASVISGTIFEATKLPLTTWFLGIYLLTQTKNGVSALELRRHLRITYNPTLTPPTYMITISLRKTEGYGCFGKHPCTQVVRRGRGSAVVSLSVMITIC
ncbi:MAG: transposase [Chromatiaceae bacterium]|nr:transposase [Chromatiaceae bacterium]